TIASAQSARAAGSTGRRARARRARTPSRETRARGQGPGLRRSASSMRAPGERRQVPEDAREVAVAEEDHRDCDERERVGAPEQDRAWPQTPREGHDRHAEERPAHQMMEERRALEEPRVLLVDEECTAGDDER